MNHAVITKARAMYGKRFTPADYKMLAACRTVEECALTLRAHPAYCRAFSGVDVRGIRRDRIELLIKREYALEFERLVKGLSEKELRLAKKFIGTYELEFIMWTMRHMNLSPLERAPYMQLYEPLMRKYSGCDIDALTAAKSRRDIIYALPEPYRSVGLKAVAADGTVDYLTVENEIWKTFYDSVDEIIKKEFAKDDSAALFGLSVDLYNIIKIFRLRTYFDYTAQEIVPYLLRPLYRLRDDTVASLCASRGAKEFAAVLEQTPYRALGLDGTCDRIESAADEMIRGKAGKILHFSNSAPAVVYAYMKHKSAETDRIKTVVECVRYNISREMIDSHVGSKA